MTRRRFTGGRSLGVLAMAALAAAAVMGAVEPAGQVAERPPAFEVDPFWPKMPKSWVLGQVSGVAVDAQDHVWVLQRPWSLNNDEKARNPEAECCYEAPPVMEFDSAGHYLRGWGGPPADGVRVAHGRARHPRRLQGQRVGVLRRRPRMAERKENFLLKFTRDGRFLLQIGRRGQSQGSLDTANLNNAADMWVHPPTNELFVADGYINRRVIVFDADTGAFKRMWGAYGRPPDDEASKDFVGEGPGPRQFNTVHGIKVSADGLVYVNDRLNNRVQVFGLDGTFRAEVFIERKTRLWARPSTRRSRRTSASAGSTSRTPATGASASSTQGPHRGGCFGRIGATRASSSSCTTWRWTQGPPT